MNIGELPRKRDLERDTIIQLARNELELGGLIIKIFKNKGLIVLVGHV